MALFKSATTLPNMCRYSESALNTESRNCSLVKKLNTLSIRAIDLSVRCFDTMNCRHFRDSFRAHTRQFLSQLKSTSQKEMMAIPAMRNLLLKRSACFSSSGEKRPFRWRTPSFITTLMMFLTSFSASDLLLDWKILVLYLTVYYIQQWR